MPKKQITLFDLYNDKKFRSKTTKQLAKIINQELEYDDGYTELPGKDATKKAENLIKLYTKIKSKNKTNMDNEKKQRAEADEALKEFPKLKGADELLGKLTDYCHKNKINLFACIVEGNEEGKRNMINSIDGNVDVLAQGMAIAVNESPLLKLHLLQSIVYGHKTGKIISREREGE